MKQFMFLFLLPSSLMAQVVVPAGSPVASPAPEVVPKIGWLESLIAAVPAEGMAIVAGVFLVELIAKKWPSKNPQGLLHWAKYLFSQLSLLFSKLAELSDKLLGQKLK